MINPIRPATLNEWRKLQVLPERHSPSSEMTTSDCACGLSPIASQTAKAGREMIGRMAIENTMSTLSQLGFSNNSTAYADMTSVKLRPYQIRYRENGIIS